MSMPSRSLSSSLRWVWLAPWYRVLAKRTTSAITASDVALTGLRPSLVAVCQGGCSFLPVGSRDAAGVACADTHQLGRLIQCNLLR